MDTNEATSNQSAGPIVERLKAVSQKRVAARQAWRDDESAAARKIVQPRLDEARAIVETVEAERRESLAFIENVLTVDFDDLRRTVPVTVTVGSSIDTRNHVTMLERAARAARSALGDENIVALRRQISQIETTMEVDATRAVDLLGELWRLVEYAKTQPGAARTAVRNTRTCLARLEKDLAGGGGYAQTQEPPVEKITLPALVKPKVIPTRAETRFDPFTYDQEPAAEEPESVQAGPYLKVKA